MRINHKGISHKMIDDKKKKDCWMVINIMIKKGNRKGGKTLARYATSENAKEIEELRNTHDDNDVFRKQCHQNVS